MANSVQTTVEGAEPTEAKKQLVEDEIRLHQREVDYETKEYPVEVLVNKYSQGLEDDTNEIFIPDYQREMAWDDLRQSKFIESVLIGLPIPYIFVADVNDPENETGERGGRLEIVDGTQRIRTLARFVNNELTMSKLSKLKQIEGLKFQDLPPPRQRRFLRRTLRLIELTEKADEEVRRDIFERINTGSVTLQDMEVRRGIRQGPMLKLVEQCAKNKLFHRLAPMTESQIKRREREEFVLRFFAYLDRYDKFGEANKNRVVRFLDSYLDDMNKLPAAALKSKAAVFEAMIKFAQRAFPEAGFAKTSGARTTPRIRFESLAVGTALALRVNPKLVPAPPKRWLTSKRFLELTTSDSSNSRPRIIKRIEYVRDKLLEEG